jgi:serine/threonine-protein kinase
MKRCTTCRRVYDRDAVVCAVDGSNLDDFVSDPLVGRAIAKRYRLVQRLGGGSLGTVYLAAAGLTTGRPVAVKIFAQGLRCDEDTLKQCRWDARFASASHPVGIVRVYEVDRTDEGQIFIAMDYLEGESLADLIHREGRLELVRALRLASQIAQALAAALNAGVIHSEIKPHNVMVVGPEERVKLTDFGIGRLRRIATGAALDRPVGVAHAYAAPEQIAGGEAVDRTDVYGLGAVLYAMLTGAPPRPSSAATAETPGEARQIIRTLRPDVPAALEHLLMQTMAHEPERRPSSMTEVAEHLLDVTASLIAETTAAQARAARSACRDVPPPARQARKQL